MKRLVFILIMIVCYGCTKEELTSIEIMDIAQDCRDNAFNEVNEIEANLQGKWKLVGYKCGFCVTNDNDPESKITFDGNTGVIDYKDLTIDTTINFTYIIEEGETILGVETYQLKSDPNFFPLQFDLFCKDYISYDYTPLDGPMFLFQKE